MTGRNAAAAPWRIQPNHSRQLLRRLGGTLSLAWQWLAARRRAQVESRQLRVVETVHLGEKRYATLLEVDGVRLLVGGTANQLTLLARLDVSVTAASTDSSLIARDAGGPQ